MRFVVLALLAGCGVQIGGESTPVDSASDTQNQVDAAIDSPPARPCTAGNKNMVVGNECLMLFTGTPSSWADANTACTSIQSHLAIIDTAAKHTAAKALVGATDAWIGLTDLAVEGQYRWVDTTVPFAFSMWNVNEPSNGGGTYEEDCTVIAGLTNREWDDRPCSPAVTGVPAGCCQYSYLCQF